MIRNKERHFLSKSTFLRGYICKKSLWLSKHRRDLIAPTPAGQQFIFDQGHEVGKLAQKLFPGGVDASPATHFDYQPSIEITKKLIAEGRQVIYEAAFQHNGVLAALDILVKKEDGWYAYEVKSSTKVHDINVTDAALQYWVMKNCGVEAKDICIVHINNEYERVGEIEPEKLFETESVLYLVIALQDEISESVKVLKQVAVNETCPTVLIDKQCTDPYTCDFKKHCWESVPDESILDFGMYRKEERFRLYHSGIKRIADVTPWKDLKVPYNYIVEAHINKGIYVDDVQLKNFMKTIIYPVYFMDFETVRFAVPKFNNSYPYEQIPNQYSVHVLNNENEEPVHRSYLADPGKDFRLEFIETLLDDLGSTGTILAYNVSFEKSCLKMMAFLFPQYEVRINAVIDRLVDLALPFQKKWYYDSRFSCSYSIKDVLPVIAPDLSYKNLAVNNGDDASVLFMKMMQEPNKDWSAERKNLIEYCGLDTWAMVRIFRHLNTIV